MPTSLSLKVSLGFILRSACLHLQYSGGEIIIQKSIKRRRTRRRNVCIYNITNSVFVDSRKLDHSSQPYAGAQSQIKSEAGTVSCLQPEVGGVWFKRVTDRGTTVSHTATILVSGNNGQILHHGQLKIIKAAWGNLVCLMAKRATEYSTEFPEYSTSHNGQEKKQLMPGSFSMFFQRS